MNPWKRSPQRIEISIELLPASRKKSKRSCGITTGRQTTQDPTIKAVIEHNRNEEMEHAAMLLEWLRRNMPGWDEALRTYLFTEAPITEIEALAASGEGSSKGEGSDLSLNIGSLKE